MMRIPKISRVMVIEIGDSTLTMEILLYFTGLG
jgi:hypothetical protein